jgi:cholesterol transport system auxiliary component
MSPTLLRAASNVLLVSACVLLLSACGLSRPALVKQYYLLQLPALPDGAAPAHPVAIKVNGFEVSPPFAGSALVYRLDEERYDSDFYHEFFIAPRSMVTSRMAEWMAARGIFSSTLPPSSTLDAPYAMEGLVNAMYGDLRDSAEPSSVFAMQVYVTQATAPGHRIVLERAYSHAARIPDRSAESVAKGLSLAFQQCLADLETDLRALDLKP